MGATATRACASNSWMPQDSVGRRRPTPAKVSLPGVGGAVFEAIRERDRSLLIGLVTVFILVTLVLNALDDLLIAVIDPRVRALTVPLS